MIYEPSEVEKRRALRACGLECCAHCGEWFQPATRGECWCPKCAPPEKPCFLCTRVHVRAGLSCLEDARRRGGAA